jgi:integrase
MSVYKSAKSPFYAYDFVVNGHRFHGSTKTGNKKEALVVEAGVRAQAKKDIAIAKTTGQGPLTINVAAGRYWNEVGKHLTNHLDTWRALERLIKYFGKEKRMDAITDADVAALVAWRRSQRRWGKTHYKDDREMATVSNATVNRDTTAMLKRLFMRARRTWKIHLSNEPNWRDHWLKEAEERVRELHEHEGEALEDAVREDYASWLEFARLTGLRLAETLIRWKDVNWFARSITTTGKGGGLVTTPITAQVFDLLQPLVGHHDEWVFTYIAKRANKAEGRARGKRYPITYEGAKTEWERLRRRSKVENFKFHDIRHDVATKTLRETGNLKITQRVLNHKSLKTTSRYAHVLDAEVSAALEAVAKSRKNSQTKRRASPKSRES